MICVLPMMCGCECDCCFVLVFYVGRVGVVFWVSGGEFVGVAAGVVVFVHAVSGRDDVVCLRGVVSR